MEQNRDGYEGILRENFDFVMVKEVEFMINDTGFVVEADGMSPVFVVTEWIDNGVEAVGQFVIDTLGENKEEVHSMMINDGMKGDVNVFESEMNEDLTMIDSETLDYITLMVVAVMLTVLLVLWMKQYMEKKDNAVHSAAGYLPL